MTLLCADSYERGPIMAMLVRIRYSNERLTRVVEASRQQMRGFEVSSVRGLRESLTAKLNGIEF